MSVTRRPMTLRQILVPTVLEESDPGRPRLRHLLAAPAGADRLPGPGGRRPGGQPDHLADALPRGPGPRARTSSSTSTPPAAMAYAGMAIYDVMQHVRPDVSTICVGMGMSAAAMILCRRCAREALGPAQRPDHDPPGDGGHPGRAVGHGDPAPRGAGPDPPHGRDHRPPRGRPLEQVAAGHRPGLLHDRRRGRDYGLIDDIVAPRRGLAGAGPWSGPAGDHRRAVERGRTLRGVPTSAGRRPGVDARHRAIAARRRDPGPAAHRRATTTARPSWRGSSAARRTPATSASSPAATQLTDERIHALTDADHRDHAVWLALDQETTGVAGGRLGPLRDARGPSPDVGRGGVHRGRRVPGARAGSSAARRLREWAGWTGSPGSWRTCWRKTGR